MNIAQVTTHLTIPYPEIISEDDGYFQNLFLFSLGDVLSCSRSIEFSFYNLGKYYPEIRLIKNDSKIQQQESTEPITHEYPSVHLVINNEIPYEDEEDAVSEIGEITKKRISDLIILANLCYPGLLIPNACSIMVDDCWTGSLLLPLERMDSFAIQIALEYSRNSNWPKLNPPLLTEAWSWFLSRDLYQINEGFESDSISRAYNAFSRLLEAPRHDTALHLVWAMIGIEALYGQGKKYGKQQILEKVPRILGEDPEFVNHFLRAYKIRSQFIHGEQDFPGLFILADAHPAYEKYIDDQWNTVSLATAILIATLHEIIRGNWPIFDVT